MSTPNQINITDSADQIKDKIEAIYFMFNGATMDTGINPCGALMFINETHEEMKMLIEMLDGYFNKKKAENEVLSAMVRTIE